MPPTDLPSPFDVDQLRRQAKELRTAALAGDRRARERVRQAHPRFGRARLREEDLVGFTLRDAQLCRARELGFDGWQAVLAYAHGQPTDRPWRRWPDHPDRWFMRRATEVARIAGYPPVDHDGPTGTVVGPEHALGALVRPPTEGPATEVLHELGLTWHRWLQRWPSGQQPQDREHFTFNPAWYRLIGVAEGIALAAGVGELRDEHVLLALAYHCDSRTPSRLDAFDLDADAIVTGLGRKGIAASDLRPPARAPQIGRLGPRVYIPDGESEAVIHALHRRYPPGAGFWGVNVDPEDGRTYLYGEADLDIEAVARGAVTDPATVVTVPIDRAREATEPH